jgi:hypothetical protein
MRDHTENDLGFMCCFGGQELHSLEEVICCELNLIAEPFIAGKVWPILMKIYAHVQIWEWMRS